MHQVTTVRVSRECTDTYIYVALCLAGMGAAITAKANREPGTDVPKFQPKRFTLQTDGEHTMWETVDGGWITVDTHVVGIPLIRRLHDKSENPQLAFVILLVDLGKQESAVDDMTYIVTPEGDEWSEDFEETALRAVLKLLSA